MPDLLLELGTEELPAHSVRRAYRELGDKIASLLIEERVLDSTDTLVTMGTPRRLIVSIPGIESGQANSTKDQRGPGLKAAYDADGNPTQALLGFCRSQGVDPVGLRQDGQYVWITKEFQGRSTLDILSDHLPRLIRSLTFDKTMRWGVSKMKFARPIRWILATFNSEVIPFDLEGVSASDKSRGHRFYSPDLFQAASFSELVDGLRSRHVEPDPDRRQEMIVERLPIESGDYPDLPAPLIEENVFLTEWPTAILGQFAPEFLELPAPVLSTVMAKHEKMFPVRDGNQNLTNKFIFVRNSGEDDSVRKGCEWVLNARMNDAKFFFDEDQRQSLEAFLAKTKGILFQEKLGTVLSRSERLSRLAPLICPDPTEESFAREAGRLAKADLSTGLVSELASLQGIIGGSYAQRDRFPYEVCWAISTQYDPAKNPNPDSARARTAMRLVIADQLDKLAGYLGIGLEPSGSSDPYGLRRAVSVLIEAAWSWPTAMAPFSELFGFATKLYSEQGVSIDVESGSAALSRLFAARYPSLLPGVRHDVLEAALMAHDAASLTAPQSVRFRVALLEVLSEDPGFVQTATRPLNIVAAARKKGIEVAGDLESVSQASLDSDSGRALLQKAVETRKPLSDSVLNRDLERSLVLLRKLEQPINLFFEETMVMADDTTVRDARLLLLDGVGSLLTLAGDFTKIVFEGC